MTAGSGAVVHPDSDAAAISVKAAYSLVLIEPPPLLPTGRRLWPVLALVHRGLVRGYAAASQSRALLGPDGRSVTHSLP